MIGSRWSIKREMISVVMFTSLIAIFVTVAGMVIFDLVEYRAQMQNDLTTQAQIIGANTTAALTFKDPGAVKEILSALAAKPRIVAAEVYTPDHKLFAYYSRDNRLITNSTLPSVRIGSHFEGPYLHVAQRITLHSEVLGIISIQSDMSAWYEQMRRYSAFSCLILLGAGLIAFFLSLRLQRIISGPILGLAETMRKVSNEKNYSVCVEGSRTDEIGDLINGFNAMLVEIKQRDLALSGANSDLEMRIDERTKRLQEEIVERKSADEALRLAHGELEDRVKRRTADLATINQALQGEVFERRSAEAALRVSEDKFRSIVETTEEFIWEIDSELKMTYSNPAVESILGYSPEEIIGTDCHNIMNSDDAVQLDAVFATCIKEKRGCTGFVSRWVHKNGGYRFMERNAVVVLNEYGEVCGFRGADRDVTARQHAEHEMMQAMAAADAANRAKSLFLANMSHELRTPMNAIIGFSEILVDQTFGPLNEKQTRYTNNILNGGRHLLQLINDVLDLSKVEAGKLQLETAMFAPGQALLDVKNIVKELASKKNLTLTAEADPDIPEIEADQSKFKQILYNLISNAIKFTPDGGNVRVSIERHKPDGSEPAVAIGGWIALSVTDSGIGIKSQDQERIFAEFEQVDSSYGRKQQGTGLGLTLTRKLVELHGGTIKVSSTGIEGEGSTFKIIIPVSHAIILKHNSEIAPASAQLADPTPAPRQDTGKTVLVVEDDEKAAELLCHYLTESGYEVEVASDGEQAMERLRKIKPCMIVLDIFLPKKDGWRVMAELKTMPEAHGIPIIVVSVSLERELAFNMGAVDCFVKPVNKDQLIEAVHRFRVEGASKQTTILVVDDEAIATEMLANILAPQGFQVLKAYGGREAIEIAIREIPDAIVLDLMMPEVTGIDVVRELRSKPETASIPILIYTALSITDEMKSQFDGVVQGFASKSSPLNLVRELKLASSKRAARLTGDVI